MIKNLSSSSKIYKSEFTCEECKNSRVPFMSISFMNPLKIKILCYCCRQNYVKNFSDMEKQCLKMKGEKTLGYCEEHQKAKNCFYCKKCKINFCTDCKCHHIEHKEELITLSTLPKKETFVRKIKEAKENLSLQNKKFEEDYLKKFKNSNEKEKESVNTVLELNRKINSRLIEFTEFLLYNYNENVYETIENLIKNTNFQFNFVNEEEIFSQLNSEFILKVDIEKNSEERVENKSERNKSKKKKRNINYLKNLQVITTIGTFPNSIVSLCLLEDGRFAYSSYSNDILVISKETHFCELEIKGHEGFINYITSMKTGNLISASGDTTIRVWKIEGITYQCLHVLSSHSSSVNIVIDLLDGLLGSCSDDKTVIIWNLTESSQNPQVLKSHNFSVMSMILLKSKKYLVSCDYVKALIFWENKTFNCVKEIKGISCNNNNAMLELSNNKIAVAAKREVVIVNPDNFQVEKKISFEDYDDLFSILELDNGTLLLGGGDETSGKIFHLDLEEEKVIETNNEIQKGTITSLIQLESGQIVSGSWDASIKILE